MELCVAGITVIQLRIDSHFVFSEAKSGGGLYFYF